MPKTPILMLAPASAPLKRPRLAKMLTAMHRRGYPVRFLGWERLHGEAEAFALRLDGVHSETILRGGGYGSQKTRMHYLLWGLAVFRRAAFAENRQILYCLGLESALPATVGALVSGAQVVFDDADRFSLLSTLPCGATNLLRIVEEWVAKRCAVHVVPGLSRYAQQTPAMFLLRNSPTSDDIRLACEVPQVRPDADLVVYVNGWLTETRGLPVFLKALELLDDTPCRVVVQVAGMIDSPEARKLVTRKNVMFHGELPQHRALSLYRASDVAFTYYDPRIPINRKAEANKWGDCARFQTPFIVNSEVETARSFVARGAAWSVPYEDADALAVLLRRLAETPQSVAKAKAAIASFADEFPPFDEQCSRMLDRLCG